MASGFFWGSNAGMSPEELDSWKKERLKECKLMLQEMEFGHELSYFSWW
jgi:hypothetical protein